MKQTKLELQLLKSQLKNSKTISLSISQSSVISNTLPHQSPPLTHPIESQPETTATTQCQSPRQVLSDREFFHSFIDTVTTVTTVAREQCHTLQQMYNSDSQLKPLISALHKGSAQTNFFTFATQHLWKFEGGYGPHVYQFYRQFEILANAVKLPLSERNSCLKVYLDTGSYHFFTLQSEVQSDYIKMKNLMIDNYKLP